MNKKQEKVLREYIRKTLKNMLSEIDTATTSGMEKVKETDKHSTVAKSDKVPSTSVTKDGKPASVTAKESKADESNVEDKKVKDSDKTDELYQKGKPVSEGEKFECKQLGVELEVKGSSMASVNALYFIGQARKALEGKGQYIKKIEVEMGDKEEDKD